LTRVVQTPVSNLSEKITQLWSSLACMQNNPLFFINMAKEDFVSLDSL